MKSLGSKQNKEGQNILLFSHSCLLFTSIFYVFRSCLWNTFISLSHPLSCSLFPYVHLLFLGYIAILCSHSRAGTLSLIWIHFLVRFIPVRWYFWSTHREGAEMRSTLVSMASLNRRLLSKNTLRCPHALHLLPGIFCLHTTASFLPWNLSCRSSANLLCVYDVYLLHYLSCSSWEGGSGIGAWGLASVSSASSLICCVSWSSHSTFLSLLLHLCAGITTATIIAIIMLTLWDCSEDLRDLREFRKLWPMN